MLTRLLLPSLVCATLCAPSAARAQRCLTWAQSSPAQVSAPELTEVSGIAASLKNEGVLWVHNDSGAQPVIYALDAQGALLGTWTIEDTAHIDWEDIARARCPQGAGSCLYIADIGNNSKTRQDLRVIVVPEPDVDPQDAPITASVAPVATWALSYPQSVGDQDAEGLMVTPGGKLYVVTKDLRDAHLVEFVRSGDTLTGVDHGVERRPLVTAIDLADDGSRVVFRNYFKGEVFELERPEHPEDVWGAQAAPERFNIRSETQGEAIAFTPDGRMVSLSERLDQPLHYYDCVPAQDPAPDASADTPQDAPSDALPEDEASDEGAPSLAPAQDSGCAHAPGSPTGLMALLWGAGLLAWRRARRSA